MQLLAPAHLRFDGSWCNNPHAGHHDDNAANSLGVQVQHSVPLVPTVAGVDCVPSYFIIGGLVFIPLTVPFLDHGFGSAASRSQCVVALDCQQTGSARTLRRGGLLNTAAWSQSCVGCCCA